MASNESCRRSTRAPGFIKSAGLLLLLFWLCSYAGAAEKVRISVTNYNMSYLAAGVAAKKGYFKGRRTGSGNHQDELQHRHVGFDQWRG